MAESPSTRGTIPNTYSLEDLVTYCRCPLRLKYKQWGATEKVVDAREAIRLASRDAIRAYMHHGASSKGTPRRALDRATMAYKKSLLDHDKNDLFKGDPGWITYFNFGLVLIRKFHLLINPKYDSPIMGPKSCAYPLGDDVVVGDIDGFIAFNTAERSEMRYGVVTVSEKPAARSTWERMIEGFAYGSFRLLTKGLNQVPVSVINVDPHTRKIMEYEVGPEQKNAFEALASAAIQGIKHRVFVPQPVRANCATCPYDSACQIKYARPGDDKWQKREFLGTVE